jgi:hypothetical protein
MLLNLKLSILGSLELLEDDPGREEKEFDFSGGLDNQVLVE